jgi:hypothetical protein
VRDRCGHRSGVHDLRDQSTAELRARHSDALCVDDDFWEAHAHARYATLMYLADVRAVPELHIDKRDRRGWVVLDDSPLVHEGQLYLAGLGDTPPCPPRLLLVAGQPPSSNRAQPSLPGYAWC